MNRLTNYTLLAGAAASALIALPSYAQENQATGVEEVVVTARRVQEKLQDVPIAVAAFTSKDLEEKRIENISDLGMGIPNVRIRYGDLGTAGSPDISIRGQNSVPNQIATDSAVGIYIDGVYVGRTLGLAFDLADMEQAEVLRGPQGTLLGKNTTAGAFVLTTKAPSGVLDGHLETSFGNYDLKRVKGSFDLPEIAGFSIRGAVLHEEHSGYKKNPLGGSVFTWPQPFGVVTTGSEWENADKNAGSIAVRYTGIDDLTVDFKADYSEDFSGANAVQNLGYVPGSFLEGIAKSVYAGAFGPVGPYIVPVPGLVGPSAAHLTSIPTWDGSNTNSKLSATGASLTAQYDLYDNLTLKSITAWRMARFFSPGQDQSGEGPLTPVGKVPLAPASGPAGSPFCITICGPGEMQSQHQLTEELQVIGHEDRFDWIAGFFYFDEIAFINDPAPFFPGAIPNNSYDPLPLGLLGLAFATGQIDSVENQSWAFYGHTTVHLNDVVDLSGGIRYTYDYRYFSTPVTTDLGAKTGNGPFIPLRSTSHSFDNVDWDLSLTWKVMPDVNAYGKVSTGYLSGGTLGSGPFDPVFVTNYEVGLKSDWFDHRLRVNADVWHLKSIDTQTLQLYLPGSTLVVPPGTPFGAIILSNPFLHTSTNGFDLETTLVPLKGLTFGFNFGVQSSPAVNNVPAGRPAKNIGINAEYDFPRFDNDMYFAVRFDATWLEGHQEGLTTGIYAVADPVLLNTLLVPDVWVLDMRATLFDIPLGPVKGKVALWVKNLTDEQELNFAIDTGFNISGTYDLPRTYGVDLSIDF